MTKKTTERARTASEGKLRVLKYVYIALILIEEYSIKLKITTKDATGDVCYPVHYHNQTLTE